MAKCINIRNIFVSSLALITLLIVHSFIFAADTVTITTYYPSPYGSYRQLYVSDMLGIGTTGPGAKLHIKQAAPSGIGSLPSNVNMIIDSNTHNYLLFRNSADNSTYAGLQFQDNNVGGYLVFQNWSGGATSDSMLLGTYQDFFFQAGSSETVGGKPTVMTIKQSGNVGIGTTVPGFPLDVNGQMRAERYRGINSLVLNTYATVNPASNVFLYSQPNDRDSWLYLDSADTGSNWGIYHRQIDSAVSGLPGNAIGFVGGGASALQAYISLANGAAFFNGNVGIGTTAPANKLEVSGGNIKILTAQSKLIFDHDLRYIQGVQTGGADYLTIAEHSYAAGIQLGFANAASAPNYPFYPTMTITSASGASGNVGIGTTSPASGYKLDVNGLIKGGGTAEAWSAVRTGYVNATPSTGWTAIPGLSVTFTLSRPALVQMVTSGTQRTVDTGSCHIGYRYTIDGVPEGDAGWGQGINMSHSDQQWWTIWALTSFKSLAAGSHTIRVDTRGGSTATCNICAESGGALMDYNSCRLNISAFYN